MLRFLQHVVHQNVSTTCISPPIRYFSKLGAQRSWPKSTPCFCPHLLHHRRQVQRSHTKENVGAAINAPLENSSSWKSVYETVTQPFTANKDETFSDTAELSLRYITVHTLYDFYVECPDGILFDVCYVDSHPDGVGGKDIKTVVILPPSPGSHLDVLPLMRPLVRAGYRVVAVNFPGYGKTNAFIKAHEFIFRGATDERTDFLLQFLKELRIDKVDMLIAQGSGCYPAIDLAASHTWIKSLALICPGGHRVFRGVSPYQRVQRMARMFDKQLYRLPVILWVMMMKYIQRQPHTQNVPILHIIKSIIEAAHYQFESMETNIFAVVNRQLPLTFVYSGQDSFVETEISRELALALKLKPEEFAQVDSDNYFIYPEKKKSTRGLYLQTGRHSPLKHERHCDVIALMLIDELKRTTKNQS